MRADFRLLLLYTLSSCLSSDCYTILKQQTGSVIAGETIYFSLTLQLPNSLAIVLKSLQGDCDLYLSQQITTKRPTHNKYDISSTTCGIDYVITHASLKYPLYIGIFGYPSVSDCEFQVDIVQLDSVLETVESETIVQFDIDSYVQSNEGVYGGSESEESDSVWKIIKFILQILEVLV